MAAIGLLSPSSLRKVVSYNPETGLFRWQEPCEIDGVVLSDRAVRWWTGHAGKPALRSSRGGGYIGGIIFARSYLAHRVALAWMNGQWPEEVDHINHDRADNRFANLRNVSRGENARNQSQQDKYGADNVFGVRKDLTGRWLAQIYYNRRTIYLGRYDTKKEAIIARKAAEKALGYHPNHGA